VRKTLFDGPQFGDDEPEMKTAAIVPYFGCNRMLADAVGEELAGCNWVGVPFAGGMPELAKIKASTIVVGDLHRHVINLALCIKNPDSRKVLIGGLEGLPFHPDSLASAQNACLAIEKTSARPCESESIGWAQNYFVSQWMGRSGKAGTDGEFSGKLPVRWNANGGDSNKRFRSAVESIESWGSIVQRCNFDVLDVFDFLARVKDQPKHGLYCDPPFPDAGGEYKHKFGTEQHKLLAKRLREFKEVRIVCRFYDHPLIRDLYHERDGWVWRSLVGRKSSNAESPERLIINGPSYPTGSKGTP
jgi:DNA adenine methylase